MRLFPVICILGQAPLLVGAQPQVPPVVDPRGVLNEISALPAPAVVAPGGLLRITGFNLGPPQEWTADSLPLPLSAGDPAVQVLINGRPAPLVTVSPSRIICQIPLETPLGIAAAVVKRGEQQSRPARFFVRNPVPALRTVGGNAIGAAVQHQRGGKLIFEAAGLGPVDPPAQNGQPGAAEDPSVPRLPVRFMLNGIDLGPSIRLSPEKPGIFELAVDPPGRIRPGDAYQLVVNNIAANLATAGTAAGTEAEFLPFSEDAPEVRAISMAPLNSDLLLASGRRGADGCYPVLAFDFSRRKTRLQPDCLTVPNRAATSAVLAPGESAAMVSFLGPASDPQPGQGFSQRLRIFHPAADGPVDVTLPAPALGIATAPDGSFIATTPGAEVRGYRIDTLTGNFSPVEPPPADAPQTPANPLPNVPLQSLQLDLGDGLNKVIGGIPTGFQGIIVLVVADDVDNPRKARLAAVRQPGPELIGSREFPEGWLPLASPAPPLRPGQPASPRLSVSMWIDGGTRRLFVPLRAAEGAKDAMAIIGFEGELASVEVLPLPEGWFYASCTPNTTFFNLELSRRMAMFASRTQEKTFRQLCGATGYFLFDLAPPAVAALEIAGQGQINVAAGAGELNDFIYGINGDPSLQGAADTLYVLDGARGDTFRIDLPGASSFNQVRPLPDTNLLVGVARNVVAGDAGLVLFDLDRADASLLPPPEGFTGIQIQGFLPGVRKIVTRGTLDGSGNTQIVLFDYKDPATPDVTVVPNPPGVRWVGNAPPERPQPGQPAPAPGPLLLLIQPRTNAIATVGYGQDRAQRGVIVIRAN